MIYYTDYLQLDKLLDAQACESAKKNVPVHDEMLFIIIHQAYELWFKQIIHELDSVLQIFQEPDLSDVKISLIVSRSKRISRILHLLVEQIRILETMTPMDFLEFRDLLIPASGFQSVQFRIIETKLGIKRMLGDAFFGRLSARDQQRFMALKNSPSLLQLAEQWLARFPLLETAEFSFSQFLKEAVGQSLTRDEEIIQQNRLLSEEEKAAQLRQLESAKTHFQAILDPNLYEALVKQGKKRISFAATRTALFIFLYRDQPLFQQPYELLSTLITIDELLLDWRYRHILLVRRMIGSKIGTGGSAGADYLKKSADSGKIFDDIANLSSFLLPRSALLPLPDSFQKQLGLAYRQREEIK